MTQKSTNIRAKKASIRAKKESFSDDSTVVPISGHACFVVCRAGMSDTKVDVVDGMIIGRSPAVADLVIEDELVSRRHAQFHMASDGRCRVEDLGSRNGLRFQGRTVRCLSLAHGGMFTIGNTVLVFSLR